MNKPTFTISTLVIALAACSSVPDPNPALVNAQSQFNEAQRDTQVTSLASQELNQAREALRLAQMAWEEKEDTATINHLAYMASQRVKLAEDTASSMAAQAVTAKASAERDKLLLTSRTQEADRATQRANQSELSSRQATEALAAAKKDAIENERQRENRITELETALKDLNAKKTERGMVITLGDVLFDTGKSDIATNAAPTIAKLAEFLKRYPQQLALIEGHTDSTGTEAGNFLLSQQRADAVRAALLNLGVKHNQLTTQARGQDNPIADNSTMTGRQLNRRVEIVFETTSDEISSRE